MEIALLIDRMSASQAVSRTQKESALQALSKVLDSYNQGANLQPDLEIQERVGEMIAWLKESLRALSLEVRDNTDTVGSWERLETCLFHLAAEVEDATRAFWTACGPSTSVTANQLHHLCLLPADPEVTRERLRFLETLRLGLKNLVRYRLVSPVQAERFGRDLEKLRVAVRGEVFNLVPYLKPVFQALEQVSEIIPLHLLDQDLTDHADWLTRFSVLAQAYLDGDATGRDLLMERDMFLQALEKLVAAAEEVGETEYLLGLTSHLRQLEDCLENEEDLGHWLEDARENLDSVKRGVHP